MISTGICRWLFLLISLSTWTKLTESKEMRVVCYYTNWSVYRPGTAKFSPQNINPYLCTHLIYAFGGFTKENTLKPFDKYQDIEKGGYAKFTGLKTYNKNLKTLLAIGGWNEGSSRFSPMVASADRRKELVKNTVKFLRQNHFDGLDLDWEYPTFRDGGKARDKDNYAQLVKELREEFERESEKTGRPRLLLTMAVPAGIEYINKGYDVPKLTKYLDWMNILSYDYHSAFEPAVNHHAPLYALEEDSEYNYDADLNIDHTIKHYMKMGADPGKLVLGIPTYGRSYTLFNPDATDLGAPADGPGDMGDATRENGYLAYYEICEYIKDQDWEVEEPNPDAMGPYAYKDNQWVGYDDENIVRKKAEYVAENGLGGIMFWAIDNDDFRGNCHGRPYPLIEAGKEALLNAYGITEENLISPPSKPLKSKSKSRTRSKLTNQEVSSTTAASSTRRRRIKTKQQEEPEEKPIERQTKRRNKSSKKQTAESSTYSSLKIVTPSYTTPAPPSTPDAGGAFKCEDEGFFPHPKDCKKYFWCLSGAGDSGIVAHQFTCPAGLYFNKAADSCDYSQNVLCNKKLQKASTSTSTTTTEESAYTSTTTSSKSIVSRLFSTTRPPPKITAATSKTTFKQTTTTEAYEDVYDDEEEEYTDDEKSDSEEDPQVIKELLDLIKKAGGIEQLEKTLNFGSSDSSSSTSSGADASTKSPITKSLYERVLSKTSKGTLDALKKTTTVNRNSRGPQSSNFRNVDKDKNKVDRGRLEYKTITRQRPSTEKPIEEEETDDENEAVEEKSSSKRLFRTKSTPEYTNIRRARVSTTPEPTDESRNKILGEEVDEETGNDDSPSNGQESQKLSTPQYVNIRRQRPTTTESSTASIYKDIRRRPTSKPEENSVDEIENENKRRGSTTAANTVQDITSKYQTIRRGTTTQPTSTESEIVTEINIRGSTTSSTNVPENSNDSRYKIFSRSTTAASNIDKENDVNAKYQTINRSSSTTAPSIISTLDEIKTSTTRTLIPVYEQSENEATILIDVLSTTESLSSSNNITSENNTLLLQSEINISDKKLLNDTKKNLTVSESEKRKESTVVLSQPRPFSRFTTEPTSTTQASKVSQTNFKYRVRPNTASSESQGSSTTPASTTARVTRIRGSSRFNLSKRKNTTENDDLGNKIPATNTNSIRARKRVYTTTEKNVDFNEEQNRTFRPSELADLSSLTAVDFSKVKELDLAASRHRRRRPLLSTTVTSSTTGKPEETLKTGSRTLPLARKLIDPSTFGKSRRVPVNKVDDQVNASSELNTASTTKQVRGFRSTTPRSLGDNKRAFEKSKSQEDTTINFISERSSPRPRRIIRRFRTTTSSPTISELNKTSTEQAVIAKSRQSLFRTKQSQNELSTTELKQDIVQPENPLKKLFGKKPTRLPFAAATKNQTENLNNDEILNESSEDDNSEEDENIKLSESNIRESSDLNSFDAGVKQRRPLFKISPRQDSFYGKGYGNNDDKPETGKSTQEEEVSEVNKNKESIKSNLPTDPSVIVRRKLVRKYRPKESPPSTESTVSDTETQGRRRKIIRRIRPANTAVNKLDTEETSQDKSIPNQKLYIRGRPTTVTSRTTTTEIVEEEHVVPKRIFRPTYYSKSSEDDDNDEEEDSYVASSTPYISIENINDDREHGEEYDRDEDTEGGGEDDEEISTGNGENDGEEGDEPQYKTILRSTSINRSHHFESNTNFENENEEQDDQDVKDKDSLVKKVKNSMVHAKNETETFVNDENMNPETENDKGDTKTNIESKEADTVKENVNENTNETTTKRNALLKPQKERPTFSRQKLIINKQETVKEIQKDTLQSAPRYRTLSRSSVTTATTVTPGVSEHGRENEVDKYKSSTGAYDISDDDVNTEATETILEISTTVQSSTTEKTAGSDQNSSVVRNLSTEAATELSNEISKHTTDSEKLLTTDNVEFKETVTHPSSIPDESTVLEGNNSYTTEIPSDPTVTTFETLTDTTEAIIKSSTVNETQRTTESARPSSSERSTEHYRRSTFRPVENRPKLNLGRRPTSTSTTTESGLYESTRKSYRNRNRNRLQKPTSTFASEEPPLIKISTTAVPINRFVFGRYSTTERSRFKLKPNKEQDADVEPESEDFEDQEDEIEDDLVEKVEKIDEKPFVRPAFKPKPRFGQTSTRKPYIANNPTSVNKFKKQKVVNKPAFVRTTSEAPAEEPKKELEDIDTDAVKNRNKNLFSKRVMNTPFAATVTTPTLFAGTVTTPNSSDAPKDESTTSAPVEISTAQQEFVTDAIIKQNLTEATTQRSSTEQTTEILTTLHHIFAEVRAGQNTTGKDNIETSTEPLNLSTTSAKGKIERIIEVNRIVEVSAKEAKIVNHTKVEDPQSKIETIPTFDKIGEISRVTVIKVVDGNGTNSTVVEKPLADNEIKPQPVDGPFIPATVVEIPASEIQKIFNLTDISLKLKLQEENKEKQRQDRKFELNNQNQNSIQVTSSGKAEIIDGRSHINIVTPKPFYNTETSTIALQALFKPDSTTSQSNVDNFHTNDELLETERSEYVNVRVLQQDQNVRLDKGIRDDSKIIPIRVLPQEEEEVTMKAHVVEVKPEPNSGRIKIVPIRVEMSRKLDLSPSVFNRVQRNGNTVPFVRTFETGTQFVKPDLVT